VYNIKDDLHRVLISEEQIQDRVNQIAQQINQDYQKENNPCLVGILKGAFIFLADLSRHLSIKHSVDFLAISSYGKSGAVSNAVRLIMDLREPIEGRNVIIVEDILDSGRTLEYLYESLQQRHPASLKTCVLVKKNRESVSIPVDYLGFEIPDVWVVGYGLDYAESYRTLPYIAELKEEIYNPH